MNTLYALIMAGGGGTRLWPLSRRNQPKQMLSLVEDDTMFQIAVRRLSPLLPPDRIFIVTGQDYVADLQASVPEIPKENFVVEPYGMNTAPAVGLGAVHIQRRDPHAIVAVLTADQHIAEKAKFRRVLAAAGEMARRGHIVTLGITPAFPSTGYGYIRRGDFLDEVDEFRVFKADGFTEKPDMNTARSFVQNGLYSWNSGMFIFQAETLLEEYRRQQPEMYEKLQTIRQAIGSTAYESALNGVWGQMPRLSIDYAIMENAANMAVIPVEMGWSDVGSWKTLYEVLEHGPDENVTRGAGDGHLLHDTKRTFVYSNKRVATIGVEDLVIVDTDNVLFICHRDRAEDVREIVNQLKQNGEDDYL